MSSTSFKYSNKVTEPDLDIANVYEICYAPRSTRRTKGPIYALDFYTNNVVMFEGAATPNTSNKNEVDMDDNNNNDINVDIDININMKKEPQEEEKNENEDVLEFNIETKEEINNTVKMLLADFEKSDPEKYKQLTRDPTTFHKDQYLPAIENYALFLKDPETSGIEDLAKGQFENHLQEDGTMVSFPAEPHPVIFPFHIQHRENERRIRMQEAQERSIRVQEMQDHIYYQRRAAQQIQNAYNLQKRMEEQRILRDLQESQEYLLNARYGKR